MSGEGPSAPGEATLELLQEGEEQELFSAYARIVADGDGFPHTPPLGWGEFADYWLAHSAAVVLAREAGQLIGAYYLKPNFVGRAAHIANAGYFVVAAERGRGIGRLLVTDSIRRAPALGFDALQFNLVFASNPARRLYEELGFEVVGRLPRAVEGEDALIYWRTLPPA